ncbi:MAG TPA: protein phosphatase CheZ [Burkholderiales bacterium]|nr:protein phosphatase CheZ [Burkholderiales bacterium]
MNAEATQTGDSPELEDLFDSIALAPKKEAAPAATVTPLRPAAPADGAPADNADSAELEDLFDSIAGAALTPAQEAASEMTQPLAPEAPDAVTQADRVINSVGQLTRQLHDTLVELGYDRHIQDVAAAALPDARQRIAYVVQLTEQAATRSLSAVEIATPVQESLAADAESLGAKWDAVFGGKSGVEDFKALAGATREYLKSVPAKTATTREQLTEVMMAQEFQDLTGQVLKRVTELANNLETQLLKLLVEYSPQSIRKEEALSILEGPQINGGSAETVSNQAQVDELLESLGF